MHFDIRNSTPQLVHLVEGGKLSPQPIGKGNFFPRVGIEPSKVMFTVRSCTATHSYVLLTNYIILILSK